MAEKSTWKGTGEANLALQTALGFYVAVGRVGEADGKLDEKEIEASLAVLLGLTAKSKSDLLRRAADLIATGGRGFVIMRELDERSDDEILKDLGEDMKKASIEDQYRFQIAFVVLCHAVSKATGGGFLKGGPVSADEEVATGNMLALLSGSAIGKPPTAEYILFAKAAEKFCSEQGL